MPGPDARTRGRDTEPRLAGPPASDVPVPAAVARFAVGAPLEAVWHNEAGGFTWRALDPDGRPTLYLKWSPTDGPDLGAEAQRLGWVAEQVPGVRVPDVVTHGSDASGAWLVTRAIDADPAVADRWRAEPRTAARAIGAGLRRLHDAAPVASCPFVWSAEQRLAAARGRVAAGEGPSTWHPEHRSLDATRALALLADVPEPDPVVCHGDACAPNSLIDAAGRWAGLVDLGRLGVADRWADLAVATWSLGWNFGTDVPGLEAELLDAYGIAADPRKSAYYRLLWDLS